MPWIEAKYYGATQVIDEARHVEAYARYLDEKLELTYPVNDNLRQLLELVIADPRWDITYLGMQIIVEGIALAAFGLVHQFSTEPLIKEITRYVMADEARHVAFGALSPRRHLRRHDERRAAASARTSWSRRRGSCATGSSPPRCGSASASRSTTACSTRSARRCSSSSSGCCSPRSRRTSARSACWTTTSPERLIAIGAMAPEDL